ncbi:MAG: FAD-binding oxidoreductase [Rhodospirillaceae bacterium]|nr:FAD-binding oxidoreductase [Rhodospirillaceae bacterium]MBT5239956.1 FAD-binding oxidoreductase [Rhodospirillaceae bacterium]MBT5564382.1 FAD-binding oxidoreductase [Rhodospirillaceae bacterium]MBT6090055.1 FAD-binding oxidoreductase [Rhodospirillaceae bacterium]MBT6959851.1 FAD-binding oxidoreductase [Rhodospirillaceae bacterium]
MPFDQPLLDRFIAIVGANACLTDAVDIAPYLEEERGLFHGATSVVIRPNSTDEVAAVVKLCAAEGIGVVPQGGNTGLCGGGVPSENGSEIVLALGRMNTIRAIDPTNFTMTVEAGCILADIQNKATDADCLFPLSLGAEGSCQIGGNLATNAGGINVLRYGNARDLVLGLEVVLPDGRIWNGLRALGKDNTGYALKQLFVGSEGSLGIITAAVLKLFPKPRETETAFCALSKLDDVTVLLNRARALSGDAVTAFELVPRIGLEFCTRHIDGVSDPLSEPHDWYTLIEFSTSRPNSDLRAGFEGFLEAAFEDGIIVDAVIAESQAQAENLWRIRESLPEAQKHEGGSIKHDVSVPVSRVPEFITRGVAAVLQAYPDARPCPFGHVGDGNVHFNVSQPDGMDKDAYLSEWDAMNRIVHDLVTEMNGSISAEHGIGRLKVDEMEHYKDPVELDLMKTLKAALDPKRTMNPGKVVG